MNDLGGGAAHRALRQALTIAAEQLASLGPFPLPSPTIK
jgi:hypothetical protein